MENSTRLLVGAAITAILAAGVAVTIPSVAVVNHTTAEVHVKNVSVLLEKNHIG